MHIEINRFREGVKGRIGAKRKMDSPITDISIHGEHDDICLIDDGFARETWIPWFVSNRLSIPRKQ